MLSFRRSHPLVLIPICLVCLLILTLPACSSVTNENLPTNTPSAPRRTLIRVGGDQNYPPYIYLENGQPTGFDIELLKAVADRMNLELDIHLGPWADARSALAAGQLDMVVGMAYSDERDKIYDFSVPYISIAFDIFIPNGSQITRLEDARNKAIIVQEGGLVHDYLLAEKLTTQIITVKDVPEALRLIASGKGDCAILNKVQGLYFLRELRINQVSNIGDTLFESKLHYAVQNGNDSLRTRLSEGLFIVSTNGQFNSIYEKWFGTFNSDIPYQARTTILIIFALVIAALLVIAYWNASLRRQVQKQTQDLRNSELKYRQLVENATEGVVVIINGYVVFANPAASQLSGYSAEELGQTPFLDFIHPDDHPMVIRRMKRFMEGAQPPSQVLLRIFSKTGFVHWLLNNTVRIEWEGKTALLSLFTDITDLKKAEQTAKKQLEHLAALRTVDSAINASIDLPRTLQVVVEQICQQLHVDAADILLLNPHTQEFVYSCGTGYHYPHIIHTHLRFGEGGAGRAALQREPIYIRQFSHESDTYFFQMDWRSEGFVSYYAAPLIVKGSVKGVAEIFHRSTLEPDEDWRQFLEAMLIQAAIALNNASLFEAVQQANADLVKAYDATIEGWAQTLEMRDWETQGHSQRVTELAVDLSRRMKVPEAALIHIRRGALLHDIGKMCIPDDILFKKGPLNENERLIMQQHPIYAEQLLSPIEFLAPALEIPYCHHERWDGSGYPRGLRGTQIPISARIFAVIDVWDAMRFDRPYHSALPEDQVLQYIHSRTGSDFDPEVVHAFHAMLAGTNP